MVERVVIAGASGVIGAAAVETFAARGFDVVALSRRKPALPASVQYSHVPLDLADAPACGHFVRQIGGASHLVYAAAAEAPGLASGWSDPGLIALNKRMFANLAGPLAAMGKLAWTGLLQGTKAYGAHLHPIALPAREDRPRDPHANFYFEQEDCMRGLASAYGFAWTILRPQVVFGGAPGAAMNPVAAIGAYAALCRKLGLPFAYPSTARAMFEATDAALLGEALLWAAGTPAAHGEIFNLTNGDAFVLQDAWPEISSRFGLEPSLEPAGKLAPFFAQERCKAAWREMAQQDGLAISHLDEVLGQSHHYVDMLLDERMVEGGRLPIMVSGIKIRKAGFGACRDSLDSMVFWLRRMSSYRLIPWN